MLGSKVVRIAVREWGFRFCGLVKTEKEDLERACFWRKRVRMAWTNTTMTTFQDSHLLISVGNARVIRCMSTYNADLSDTVLQNRPIVRHILAATPHEHNYPNSLFRPMCIPDRSSNNINKNIREHAGKEPPIMIADM